MKGSQVIVGSAVLALVAAAYVWGSHQGQALGEQAEAGGQAKKATLERKLSTSGNASFRVKPDSARVFFRVETYAPQVKLARADNGRKTKQILDSIKSLQIANLKSKSDNVNVALVLDSNRTRAGELPRVLGYHIAATFTVLVENEDAVKLAETAAKVLDTALENGATGVDRIVFFKKDTSDVRRRLLTRAVEDALANARALASGAGEKIIEALTITDEPRYHFAVNPLLTNTAQVAPGQGGEGTPLVAGDLEVTCNVNVTCRY
jgi:uncharacterized protein YggE